MFKFLQKISDSRIFFCKIRKLLQILQILQFLAIFAKLIFAKKNQLDSFVVFKIAAKCVLVAKFRFDIAENELRKEWCVVAKQSTGSDVALQAEPRGRGAVADEYRPGLKGSIGDRSHHSKFSHQNSVKILSEFRKIHQKFSENFGNLRNSQHFLKHSAKFREIFVRIGAKFNEKMLKTSDFTEI